MRRAFTLIELLVVIAIIAILASLLLRRFQGQATGPAHQMHEQHEADSVGPQMHVTDNNDYLPYLVEFRDVNLPNWLYARRRSPA